jgi:PTS system glucitol/sorbitol-specific IIA component
VFKFNGLEEVELPGEIYLEPTGDRGLEEIVRPGVRVEIRPAT